MVKISVIVPVFNTSAHLDACIRSLRNQDYPRDDYEILMVDNNSTDDSPAILAAAQGIRALHEAKQGSYAARNRAAQEALGSILAFTDSDCLPDPGWLRAIDTILAEPKVQVVQGIRRPASNHGLVRMVCAYEAKKQELIFASSCEDVYYGFTNNMGVRRSTYDQYGPFVECERGADTIFVQRVVQGEGCEAVSYTKTASVEHAEMDNIMTYCRKKYAYGRSRQLYQNIMKNRPLSLRDTLQAFRASLQDGQYSWVEVLALVGGLALGMLYWSLGVQLHRWRKPKLDTHKTAQH